MDRIFTKFKIFIGGGVKRYIENIASSSNILGRIGDEYR